MLTFKQFITEKKIHYKGPNIPKEFGEIEAQASLPHGTMPPGIERQLKYYVKHPKKYKKDVKKGKTEKYSAKQLQRGDVTNTGDTKKHMQSSDYEDNSPEERAKQENAFGTNGISRKIEQGKKIRKPLLMIDPDTGKRHLVGGHHRTVEISDEDGQGKKVHTRVMRPREEKHKDKKAFPALSRYEEKQY